MEKHELREVALRLTDMRAELLTRHPFFGRLLLRLPFRLENCGTAYTDMSLIAFDPAFVSRLDHDGLSFLVLHELLHCVLKHCTRGKGKMGLLYNIACDIVVNSVILEAMGKRDITLDGSEAMHLAPNGEEGHLYSAEEVYRMLLREEEAGRGLPGGRNGATSGGHHKTQTGGRGASGQRSAQGAAGGGTTLEEEYEEASFDSHEAWDSIETGSLTEEAWDTFVGEAARSAGTGSGIPHSLLRHVDAVKHKPRISWRQVLHDYIQNNRGDYDFAPPDRRFSGDLLLPAFREEMAGDRVEKLWFVIDTSGSVSGRAIFEAFCEIKDAIDQVGSLEGMVSFFDEHITAPIPFEDAEELERIKPVGGGGTSFHVIFQYLARELREEPPRVIIIITDGYAAFPSESDALEIPVIWIIQDSDREPPFGEVLHVYSPEE